MNNDKLFISGEKHTRVCIIINSNGKLGQYVHMIKT